MKSFAVAICLVACTPDVDPYPVVPSSNPPILGQAHQPPTGGASPDAAQCPEGDGGIGDGGVGSGQCVPGSGGSTFPDGGVVSQDAGGMPSDAGVPTP